MFRRKPIPAPDEPSATVRADGGTPCIYRIIDTLRLFHHIFGPNAREFLFSFPQIAASPNHGSTGFSWFCRRTSAKASSPTVLLGDALDLHVFLVGAIFPGRRFPRCFARDRLLLALDREPLGLDFVRPHQLDLADAAT